MKHKAQNKTQLIEEVAALKERLRRLEEEAENNRALFEKLVARSPIGLVVVKNEGQLVYFNPKVTKLLGYELAEIPDANTWFDLFYPDPAYRQMVKASWAEITAAKTLPENQELDQTFLFRLTAKDSTEKVIMFRVARLDDDGFLLSLEDDTQPYQTQMALRESRQMLQFVLDTIPTRVFWKDRDSRFLGCNKIHALDKNLNSPEEIVGKSDFEFSTPEQANAYITDDRRVMETGESKLNYEESSYNLDGTVKWIRTNKVPFRDAEGNTIGILGTYENITRQKETEKALKDHAHQLETLRRISLNLTAQLDLDVLLHDIVVWAVELLSGSMGGFSLYRPHLDALELAVAGESALRPTGEFIHWGEGMAGKVWETGQTVIVNDYWQWHSHLENIPRNQNKSVVGVPITWGDTFFGVLEVMGDENKVFSKADAELLTLLGLHAAIAIRNTQMYQAEQKKSTQLAVVNKVARKTATILDHAQPLQEIVDAIQNGFGYHNVSLFQVDEKKKLLGNLFVAGQYTHGDHQNYTQPFDEGIAGWCAKTGQLLLVNDVTQDSRYIVGYINGDNIRSELCVPLKLADRVIGVLDVQEVMVNAFDYSDLQALETLADQIAIAIENSRMYQQAQRDAEAKTTLLKEVNHRVNNNLAAIIGLISMEQNRANVNTHAEYQQVMRSLTGKIRGLAAAHHLLSSNEWADLSLEELVRQVTSSSLRSLPTGKNILFEVVSSRPVYIPSSAANNVALVVNELVTNAIKYAWPERASGRLTVRIEQKNNTITIHFADDGIGYPPTVLNLKQHNLGWELMQTIIKRGLNGEINLRNERGAVAIIEFPAQQN